MSTLKKLSCEIWETFFKSMKKSKKGCLNAHFRHSLFCHFLLRKSCFRTNCASYELLRLQLNLDFIFVISQFLLINPHSLAYQFVTFLLFARINLKTLWTLVILDKPEKYMPKFSKSWLDLYLVRASPALIMIKRCSIDLKSGYIQAEWGKG